MKTAQKNSAAGLARLGDRAGWLSDALALNARRGCRVGVREAGPGVGSTVLGSLPFWISADSRSADPPARLFAALPVRETAGGGRGAGGVELLLDGFDVRLQELAELRDLGGEQ